MMETDFGASSEELAQQLSRWFARTTDSRSFIEVSENIAMGTWNGQRVDNQDQLSFCRFSSPEPGLSFIGMILCDGIGGLKDGGKTARYAVASIISYLANQREPANPAALLGAVHNANRRIFEQYKGKSGSTLSAAVFTSGGVALVNVGDSRIYAIDSNGVTQLSIDDTLAAHIPASYTSSRPLEPEFDSLVQYLGMGSALQLRTIEVPGELSVESLLVSSDGAHFLGHRLLAQVRAGAPRAALFVRRVIALAEWLGGTDNATVGILPAGLRPHSLSIESRNSAVLQLWDPRGSLEVWLDKKYNKTVAYNPPDANDSDPRKTQAGPRRRTKSKASTKSAKSYGDGIPLAPPEVVLQFGNSSRDTPGDNETGTLHVKPLSEGLVDADGRRTSGGEETEHGITPNDVPRKGP